jgi:hypothetical protein
MRALVLLALFFLARLAAAQSDPLAVMVRPQLPDSVRTVGEAAAYYLGTVDYRFHAATPRTGDFRALDAA